MLLLLSCAPFRQLRAPRALQNENWARSHTRGCPGNRNVELGIIGFIISSQHVPYKSEEHCMLGTLSNWFFFWTKNAHNENEALAYALTCSTTSAQHTVLLWHAQKSYMAAAQCINKTVQQYSRSLVSDHNMKMNGRYSDPNSAIYRSQSIVTRCTQHRNLKASDCSCIHSHTVTAWERLQ